MPNTAEARIPGENFPAATKVVAEAVDSKVCPFCQKLDTGHES